MTIRFRLEDISKTYPAHRPGHGTASFKALDGVNLEFHEQQVCALTGKSGAGKTTLARVLLGMEQADGGRVLFRDRPLNSLPRTPFNRSNQMMFQNPLLAVNPCFSVRQIISEPLRIAARKPAPILEKVRAALALLELPDLLLERRPCQLSGGELQRVVLARALVLEPEFLVLDEPFSSLDDLTAWRILQQFKKIFLRLRLGVLFIGHHQRHIRFLADRTVVLEAGRLRGCGC